MSYGHRAAEMVVKEATVKKVKKKGRMSYVGHLRVKFKVGRQPLMDSRRAFSSLICAFRFGGRHIEEMYDMGNTKGGRLEGFRKATLELSGHSGPKMTRLEAMSSVDFVLGELDKELARMYGNKKWRIHGKPYKQWPDDEDTDTQEK